MKRIKVTVEVIVEMDDADYEQAEQFCQEDAGKSYLETIKHGIPDSAEFVQDADSYTIEVEVVDI